MQAQDQTQQVFSFSFLHQLHCARKRATCVSLPEVHKNTADTPFTSQVRLGVVACSLRMRPAHSGSTVGQKLRRQDFYRAHNAAPASTDSPNNLGHLHGGSIPLTIHGDRVNAGP
jgi:hypothetical protein